MYSLLNLGSLIFGLAAWIIPVVFLVKNKFAKNNSMKGIFYSLVCVIISLLMQMIYTKHLVDINDWSALMDTQGAVVFAASVLLVITIVLNGWVLNNSINNYSD